jgi:hypothetical protein
MSDRDRRTRRRARIVERSPLPVEQVYSMYYRDSGLQEADLMQHWLEVAEILDLDPQKMRPTDRFDVEYAAVATFSFPGDELEDLHDRMLDICAQRGIPAPSNLPGTLDQYVKLLSRKKA